MNYREKIRKAIDCPQFSGGSAYGEWGALRLDQRIYIKRLLDELDSADSYIKHLEAQRYKAIEYIYLHSTQRKYFADVSDRIHNQEIQFKGRIEDLLEILGGNNE